MTVRVRLTSDGFFDAMKLPSHMSSFRDIECSQGPVRDNQDLGKSIYILVRHEPKPVWRACLGRAGVPFLYGMAVYDSLAP